MPHCCQAHQSRLEFSPTPLAEVGSLVQDLHSLFERDFDYLVTISENEEQPINGAMHFVPKGKYHQV